MTLNCIKLGRAVTFMKYLASVVSLIFLPKTLIWNKITFRLSNLLNLAELVVNELTKRVSSKIFTNIPFSIRFITAYCKDFRSLKLKNEITFQKSSPVTLLLIVDYQTTSFEGEGN